MGVRGEDGRASPAALARATPLPGSDRKLAAPACKPVLAPAESAVLREQLEAEVVRLADADALLAWARRRLTAKNTLTAEDARTVEQAFAAKRQSFEAPDQGRPVED